MKVIDPGHVYELDCLDHDPSKDAHILRKHRLIFVKREGERFPGNVGTRSGTTTQEVLRALIDRTKYVDAQIHSRMNHGALNGLRAAMFFLELRAAGERGEDCRLWKDRIYQMRRDHATFIEDLPTCSTCGHVFCTKHVSGSDPQNS